MGPLTSSSSNALFGDDFLPSPELLQENGILDGLVDDPPAQMTRSSSSFQPQCGTHLSSFSSATGDEDGGSPNRMSRARRASGKRRASCAAAEDLPPKSDANMSRTGSCASLSSADGGASEKKARFVWEPEVHKRFCEAVHTLGVHAAKPQAIAHLMQMHGPGAPTRQNIKSHLQKYRIFLAKRQQAAAAADSSSAAAAAAQQRDAESDALFASFGLSLNGDPGLGSADGVDKGLEAMASALFAQQLHALAPPNQPSDVPDRPEG